MSGCEPASTRESTARTRRRCATGSGRTEAYVAVDKGPGGQRAGSTTLKLRLLGSDDSLLIDREISAERGEFDAAAAEAVIAGQDWIEALGHRFVHGGSRLTSAARLDGELEDYLRSLVDLAPLHQPAALEGVDLPKRLLPAVPAMACVDTAFHARIPRDS